MSLYRLTISHAISLSIVILVLGAILIGMVGLINGNFLPIQKETQIMITKSPTQIIYRGPSKENIITVIKELKDIPYAPYIFNTNTEVHINNTDKNIEVYQDESRTAPTKKQVQVNDLFLELKPDTDK